MVGDPELLDEFLPTTRARGAVAFPRPPARAARRSAGRARRLSRAAAAGPRRSEGPLPRRRIHRDARACACAARRRRAARSVPPEVRRAASRTGRSSPWAATGAASCTPAPISICCCSCRRRSIAEGRGRVEQFVAFLWDIGLEVGHSVRTVEECAQESAADVGVMTTLLEARLLTGNAELLARMRTALGPDHIWPVKEFFEAKVQQGDARRGRPPRHAPRAGTRRGTGGDGSGGPLREPAGLAPPHRFGALGDLAVPRRRIDGRRRGAHPHRVRRTVPGRAARDWRR